MFLLSRMCEFFINGISVVNWTDFRLLSLRDGRV